MTVSKGTGDAGAKTGTKITTQISHWTPMSPFDAEGMAIHCRANTVAQRAQKRCEINQTRSRRSDTGTLAQILSAISISETVFDAGRYSNCDELRLSTNVIERLFAYRSAEPSETRIAASLLWTRSSATIPPKCA